MVSPSTQNVNLKIGNFFFHFLRCFQSYLSAEDLGKSNIQFLICKTTLNRKANDKTANTKQKLQSPEYYQAVTEIF